MAPPSKKSSSSKTTDGPKLHKSSKKSFKTKKKPEKPDGAAQSEALALQQFDDDVPDFPRGGGSLLSRREHDEVRAEVDAEFEAEELSGKKKKKTRNLKKSHTTEDDLGSLFGDGINGKLPRFANRITWKNVSPGMKLWGVISEVNEKDLVISLPGGLRGLVRASEAFDPVLDDKIKEAAGNVLPRLFQAGQLVACIVLQLDDDKKEKGKGKIWLSLRLSLLHKGFTFDSVQEGMVLSSYVKSIEDHGYILHFGSPSFTGFLSKSSSAASEENELNTGKLLQGVVKSIDKARKVVYLSCDPNMVSKCLTKDVKGISIDLLVPGMMVNARVQSTLENGIMLSFLTYFTGTVDVFHLQNSFPTKSWKDDYVKNKKVNARILFIDPSTRAVGLTLNPHLVHNKAPPSLVKIGDIYDQSKVVRVDRGFGILLEIPSTPVSTPAYVGMFDVADGEIRKLDKKFKEGSRVRIRILGFRNLEGLAMGTSKESAFEGSLFTHSDVKPGMLVKGKVIAVDSFGAIVQFPSGVKALCPLCHMSEFDISKPGKKFKVKAEMVFRVLGCKSKRITVTHKKTLVKSKLDILSSYADATEGLVVHGWISKIEKHGCFVRFYNGVQGFVPRSEFGLEPGDDASSMYHVGQVVKCRVTRSVPASRRIDLSFVIKPSRVTEDDDMVKVGSIVSGVVDRVTPRAIIVYVNAKGYSRGTVATEHLSDNHGLSEMMKSLLKPGYEFDQLLVLDVEANNLTLSAKYSLINLAQELPMDHTKMHPNSVVHGYICNLIDTGCFVRFLGRLTGFSSRKKATDDQRANLSESFYVGQSVRSNILDVNSETGRITLSLKQSCCSSMDASLIQEYFLTEEKIARMQLSGPKESGLKWVDYFNIGSIVEGKIHEAKDYGVVISFEKYNDVFGFISHHHLGGTTVKTGSIVQAVVLDVAKAERLVDLTLKPEFVNRSKEESSNRKNHSKKRKSEAYKDPEVLRTVRAVVEIVKDNYLVLSVPDYNYTIGYASTVDYNTQKFPQKQFVNGQSVNATIMALPSPSTSGRLLMLLKSTSEATETPSSKRAKKKSSYNVGSLVQAEITEIKPLELRLKFGIGFRGRVHITEANGDDLVEDPFSNFRIGQTLTARIIAKASKSENDRKSCQWELSIKPMMLADSGEIGDKLMTEDFSFAIGGHVIGYVYKVDKEWVWITISRNVKAQLFLLDSACEPSELQEFQKRFIVGKTVSGHILSLNKEKKILRLVLRPLSSVSNGTPDGEISNEKATTHIHEGDIVGGRISKILPGVGGLLVQIGPYLYGKVHFTELTDSWVSEPLSGYREGQFVKCKVLEISRSVTNTVHVDLSLRPSLYRNCPSDRVEKIEDLCRNMAVQGYVKNVTSKGCFILLSRKLDAKILVSNLSDGYVEDLEKEFPIGKLVSGRVLSVEPLSKRVEVTLKTLNASSAQKSETNDLTSLRVGKIISGRIKQVQPYGLFIVIDHTNMVGLCHVSEISDDPVDSIETKYRAGECVKAKILKIDEERKRISLGMKSSYIKENVDDEDHLSQRSSEVDEEDGSINDIQFPDTDSQQMQNMDIDLESGECPVISQAESRAAVLPLEVTFDDIADVDNVNEVHVEEAETIKEKTKRWERKKAKEERELEIRAAEERLLEKNIPVTAEEFEKLVRSSPNSSFVWIKYMAFMLSLADVAKARSIAERALKTINFREESEKLNIWVAYFNLENEHGNPREEAVKKIFDRAVQYCEPKKVYLALLGMYERTEQDTLADDLLKKMTKRFKKSCKVWLRVVQRCIKKNQDGVHSVVEDALKRLPKWKHVKFTSQAAILELKCGVPDIGRSLFERLLKDHPKKTDVWSVYLDQEIRLGDVDVIRGLFERAVSLSLPMKKMKFLFKKYLQFEKSHGDEERIESIKQKAMDYANSVNA